MTIKSIVKLLVMTKEFSMFFALPRLLMVSNTMWFWIGISCLEIPSRSHGDQQILLKGWCVFLRLKRWTTKIDWDWVSIYIMGMKAFQIHSLNTVQREPISLPFEKSHVFYMCKYEAMWQPMVGWVQFILLLL